jgi:hypothetical protein
MSAMCFAIGVLSDRSELQTALQVASLPFIPIIARQLREAVPGRHYVLMLAGRA